MFSWLFSDPLQPGAQAPDFTLADESGKTWTLSSLRGNNVLLIFYPGDDTPVCTRQLCQVRDRWDRVLAKNVAVFGVNPCNSRSHASFRRNHNFPFPLLVDAGKTVADLYNAGGLIVKRTVYLIGPDGKIAFAQRGTPDIDDVLQAAG